MLRPFLIIGVGGSGGKTIRGLRHSLTLRLEQAGWQGGIPTAWQMIHFDTPIKQDGTDYVMPFIPPEDYKGLVASGSSYDGVHASITQKISAESLHDVERMLPEPGRVPVDVTKGAGQFRAIGRAVALSKLGDIQSKAGDAIDRMRDAAALGQLQTLGERLGARAEGGVVANPTVIIVSSIAGGSGAGQYLDVIEAVKSNIKSLPWAHQFFALLYAPDVFEQIKGSGGIPANALATVAETMSGFWTRDPSAATIELYRGRGLSPSYGGAKDRVGAAYPFIIGRQNSRVAFESQGDVYSAVSTSLAAWMTDDKVQGDIDEYATGNWAANVGANVLPDATRLMRSLDQAPPFSALGFGRLTLGREKFLDYATERLTRSVIDRMLFAHTEEDPRFEQRTEVEWIEYRKQQALEAFVREAKLDEETEERNDVIDELRPKRERDQLAAEFRNDVETRSAVGLDKSGGLSVDEWIEHLLTAKNDRVRSYLVRETTNLDSHVTDWIESAPLHLIDTTERFIASSGMAVTIELLRELSRILRSAEDNLQSESDKHRNWVNRLSSYLHDELVSAPNPESVRPDQSAVSGALDRVAQSFEWEAEANLREVASKLLAELRSDFVDPLRIQLESSREALLSRVTEQVKPDGRENDYAFWPRRVDSVVPRKYTPSPNERLLSPQTDYPQEFERLISANYEHGRFEDAILSAVRDLVDGPAGDAAVPTERRWSTIELRRSWKPRTTGDLTRTSARNESPRFFLADEPGIYQDRSRLWMLRKGSPFAAYINATLSEYFDDNEVAPGELKKRRDAFREGLSAALGTSEPLVRINPSLLSQVHGKEIGEGTRRVFSSIPFAEGSEMYELTKSALMAAGMWDDNVSKSWFKDVKTDGIEVFSMSGFPFQPVVMDSVMGPIASGWLAESTNEESRAAFWKWKRARLLREAAPVDPEVFDTILRGWYVAKILGLLKVDNADTDRGPKLEVWDPASQSYAGFPHPLLYAGKLKPKDFPGAVMESLAIALALCNSKGDLSPLRAYHVLLDLGGRRNELSGRLSQWLMEGTLPPGSPTPDGARAGTADQGLTERQEAVRAYVDAESIEFRDTIERQDTQTSVYHYPVSWEIRSAVQSSLREIRDAVLDTKPETSGV